MVFQKITRVLGGAEQAFNAATQCSVRSASAVEIGRAGFGRGALERLGEHRLLGEAGFMESVHRPYMRHLEENGSRNTKEQKRILREPFCGFWLMTDETR